MHPHRCAMKFRARGSAVEHVRHVEQKLVSFLSARLYCTANSQQQQQIFVQDLLHHPNAFLIHELYVTDLWTDFDSASAENSVCIIFPNIKRLRKVTRKSI